MPWRSPTTPLRCAALLVCLSLAGRGASGARRPASGPWDVLVYGATPAGVTAAIAARRHLGAPSRVLLLEPTAHVGGMLTAGMYDDSVVGRRAAYGGLAAEFTDRVVSPTADPHVKEAAMRRWLNESGVVTLTGCSVDKLHAAALLQAGAALLQAAATSCLGDVTARAFVDGTYEGDLLPLAGVPFALGREPVSAWNESLAGQGLCADPARDRTHWQQFRRDVDPHAAGGGLLPTVRGWDPAAAGLGDGRIQSYNFRACLTTNKSAGVAVPQPRGYNASRYRLYARLLAAMPPSSVHLSSFFSCNSYGSAGKCSTNDGPALGLNPMGEETWGWAAASPAQRYGPGGLREAFVRFSLGLWHWLATDPAVPAGLRQEMGRMYLCADEWPEAGHLPFIPHVREGRRMLSDDVFTQGDYAARVGDAGGLLPSGARAGVRNTTSLNASVGYGFWFIDCHAVQRVAVGNATRNEGCAQVGRTVMDAGGMFGIPYGLLVPGARTVGNLLVPGAPSASHIGFQAFRVEPTYMVLGEAAGTAAALLLRGGGGGTVQALDTAELRGLLRASGQVLPPA